MLQYICQRIMKWFELLGHRIGISLCLFYPTIVPKGIAEPWKYRKLMAQSWYIKFMALRAGRKHNSHSERIKKVRYLRRQLTPPLPPDPKVNVKITSWDGVQVRLHEPTNRGSEMLPGFIFFHGGGMALGSSELYEPLTRILCSRLNAVVVSVDYRLAPENIFPAGYDDCLKVTKWFMKNGGRYGVDLQRVAMGGDSAGGYLTALMTQALIREQELPNIKVQVLIYPNVQFFDICTPSYQKCFKTFGPKNGILPNIAVPDFMFLYMTGDSKPQDLKDALENLHVSAEFKQTALFKKQLCVTRLIPETYREPSYFDGPVNENKGNTQLWERIRHIMTDQRFAPLLEEDFSDLPPALVQTCEFDNLRDDGVIYAQRLESAGVKVNFINYEDGFHGILNFHGDNGFKTANKMIDDIIDFTNEYL